MELLIDNFWKGKVPRRIFSYTLERSGRSKGKTFSDQLTHPAKRWKSLRE